MSGSSSQGENFQSSQNIGTAFLANLFGQGATFGKEGVQFTNSAPAQQIQFYSPVGSQGSPFGGGNPIASRFGPVGGGFGQLGSGGAQNFQLQTGPAGGFGTGKNGGNVGGYATGPGGFGGGVGTVPAGGFAEQVFGPEDFGVLRNLLNPTSRNLLQDSALPVGALGLDSFSQMYEALVGPGAGAIKEGLETGFRTDIQPIVDVEKRRFQRETVPQLMEQFAGLTGGFSSATSSGLAQAAADLGVTLGGQQAQLDESANARRMQALQFGPAAASAISSFPINAANDFLGLGAQIQEDQFLSRPEIQLMRNLTNLFSLSPPTTGASGSSSSKSGGI